MKRGLGVIVLVLASLVTVAVGVSAWASVTVLGQNNKIAQLQASSVQWGGQVRALIAKQAQATIASAKHGQTLLVYIYEVDAELNAICAVDHCGAPPLPVAPK